MVNDLSKSHENTFLEYATTQQMVAELKRRGNQVVLILDKTCSRDEQLDEFSAVWMGGVCQVLGMLERSKQLVSGWADAYSDDDDDDDDDDEDDERFSPHSMLA